MRLYLQIMLSIIYLISLLSASICTSLVAEESIHTECLGDQTATRQLIFLQGIVPEGPLPKSLNFTPLLTRLAKKLEAKIAVVPHYLRCPRDPKKYCWAMSTNVETVTSYDKIIQYAGTCIKPNSGFGLIGFSNGGYFAAKVAMRCLSPQPKWIIAIGSAGDSTQSVSNDLQRCSPFHLLIGNRDLTRKKAGLFVKDLEVKKLKTELHEFAGGHDVPEVPLHNLIKQLSP